MTFPDSSSRHARTSWHLPRLHPALVTNSHHFPRDPAFSMAATACLGRNREGRAHLGRPHPPGHRRPGRNTGPRGGAPGASRRPPNPYPIATMRSIGTLARSATSAGTLTSNFSSARESRSFGRVIIFMYLQKAIRLASIRFAFGATCWSG